MASWLFAQYMLTNDVQMAYAQTEGYVPVTSKTQNSGEYQQYLARGGEDNDLHYDIKIDATKLLLENTKNTFVTPVFNGSASLRNAAGQLIESVNKSVRRGQEVDDPYMDSLYEEVTALYRLDQISLSSDKVDLGELPVESLTLILCIVLCWVGMLLYIMTEKMKKK